MNLLALPTKNEVLASVFGFHASVLYVSGEITYYFRFDSWLKT